MPDTRDTLRILHLEDSEPDHELALAQLRRSGLTIDAQRVETRSEFEAALARRWDAIVSDYRLPGFSGLQALRLVRARDPIVPFILVSGEIGEDVAVAAMREGASDYLLKNGLARLAPALEHAIDAARTHAAKLEADREVAASHQRLAEFARHLQTRIEAERAAIAREIHDDVGGSLTALKFEIDWIRRHSSEPAVRQRALSALETVTHAIGASQRVMHNLRPAILEQGLVPALQWLAGRFEKRTGAECVFRTRDERIGTRGHELPEGVPLVAYRTAQEALTNISKHAQATRVTMDLSVSGGVLSLEISDNGRGFSSSDLAKASSFGIRGLHERAGTVGGWIELSSGGRGTTLMLSVPLDGAPPADEAALRDDEDEDREHDPSAWSDL
ncbi:MAG: histidine kinase [Burkholderiales bacterium]|nr:histidine kinase [Burkholderiales bacterium]